VVSNIATLYFLIVSRYLWEPFTILLKGAFTCKDFLPIDTLFILISLAYRGIKYTNDAFQISGPVPSPLINGITGS
jgi:hypothetical protein